MASHELIKQGAVVWIGNGELVNIWGVPWLPTNDPYVQSDSPSLVNKRVSQLFDLVYHSWDNEILNDIFCSRDINIIQNILINVEEEDKWFWKLDRHDCYTVKSAHSLLQSRDLPLIYEEVMI